MGYRRLNIEKIAIKLRHKIYINKELMNTMSQRQEKSIVFIDIIFDNERHIHIKNKKLYAILFR